MESNEVIEKMTFKECHPEEKQSDDEGSYDNIREVFENE